ncbi:hypothetical protein DFH29DRAFT_414734 [Suillus ampliporus]|nr:hypothetical protein DFH29DRAFT_414734 [Suillus ampliporus]
MMLFFGGCWSWRCVLLVWALSSSPPPAFGIVFNFADTSPSELDILISAILVRLRISRRSVMCYCCYITNGALSTSTTLQHVACSRLSNNKFIMTRLSPRMYLAGIRPNAGGAGPYSNLGHSPIWLVCNDKVIRQYFYPY